MRDKLIELLLEVDCVCDVGDCSECVREACFIYRAADYLIANGVTFATDNNVPCKWIPVSESPNGTGEYIVMLKGGLKATSLWYSRFRNSWYDFNDDDYKDPYNNVTHWMPLPEPPKGVTNDKG